MEQPEMYLGVLAMACNYECGAPWLAGSSLGDQIAGAILTDWNKDSNYYSYRRRG